MSGYRIQNITNTSAGEALLMRALPLITKNLRHQLYGGSINFKHIQSPIEDVVIVSAADGTTNSVYRKERPAAHECVLAWCVQTLRSSYLLGNYTEQTMHTQINTTVSGFPWKMVPVPIPQIPDMVQLHFESNINIYPPSVPSNGTGFGVSNDTFYGTVMVFDQIFPSMITASNAVANPILKYNIFLNQSTFREARSSPWMAPYNISGHMYNIAQAITNTIRLDPNSNEGVAGLALYSEATIVVKWPWLTFPIIILLLCITFLIATMKKTSQDRHGGIGNWKTSAMPTLIYGLPKEMQSSVTSSLNPKLEHGEETKKIRIKLSPRQGWRVSGYACTSPTRAGNAESRAPPGWI